MKWLFLACALAAIQLGHAQITPADRRSKLDVEEGVVVLDEDRPLQLEVVKEAPVFSDRGGKHKLGTLLAGQSVRLEALTDKAYKVRGKGSNGGIAGWVPPWAFQFKEDPDFVANLKKFHARQLIVQKLIENHQVAIGMTQDEVAASKGKPTRTEMRKTAAGQDARWDYVEYKEIKHYITTRDPYTGQLFRRLSHVTQEEKSRTSIDFENGRVSAIEETEDKRRGNNVRIIVPPIVWHW